MLLSRTTLILVLLLIQLAFFFWLIFFVSRNGYVQLAFNLISILIVLYLITKEENPMYKISWIVPILIFPLFGGLFYLFYRQVSFNPRVINRFLAFEKSRKDYLPIEKDHLETRISKYLGKLNWPTYQETETKFFPSGESVFQSILEDLRKAEKYIFLEFFIINKSNMWDQILDVLKEKASQGIEVKLLYDDFGSVDLPRSYPKRLKKFGIESVPFNRMRFHINFAMNYRDHRKIVVIDGKVGYTGGINVGDEYINEINPYGHWHDVGIRIEGAAVWSLVMIFLENYAFSTNHKIDFKSYYADHKKPSNGTLIPFSDTPLDNELTTKNVLLSLMSQA